MQIILAYINWEFYDIFHFHTNNRTCEIFNLKMENTTGNEKKRSQSFRNINSEINVLKVTENNLFARIRLVQYFKNNFFSSNVSKYSISVDSNICATFNGFQWSNFGLKLKIKPIKCEIIYRYRFLITCWLAKARRKCLMNNSRRVFSPPRSSRKTVFKTSEQRTYVK